MIAVTCFTRASVLLLQLIFMMLKSIGTLNKTKCSNAAVLPCEGIP